jgi:hypothetical protein
MRLLAEIVISGALIPSAGTNLAPGNGGHTTAVFAIDALTLAVTSNFRVDINGTTVGSGYDRLNVACAPGTTNALLRAMRIAGHNSFPSDC